MSYNDTDQAKWRKVLVTEFMSSDESSYEDGQPVFVVKELPWRSEKVSKSLTKHEIFVKLRRPTDKLKVVCTRI